MSILNFRHESRVTGRGSGGRTDLLFDSGLGTRDSRPSRIRGLSLVELIVFIAVVGVAVTGVLMALDTATRGSADPMIQKQALAIAEAVLEEVQLMPFTYCDPDDANAATATKAALDSSVTPPDVGCVTTVEALGKETGEDRYSSTSPFDNVDDYDTFSMTGMTDINGNAISGLGAYTATVAVATQGIASFGGNPAIPAAEALRITVTVTGPGNTTVVLDGYRTRYAPNALP